MKFKLFLTATIYLLFVVGCSKEPSSKYRAEGYVYLTNSTQTVSNVPVVMTVCLHTGTRCIYDFVSKTYTDANGYYSIYGSIRKGSMNIEVGNNDKTFGTYPINNLNPGKIFKHNFYVDAARYVTTRFIVEPQNRNYALVSINSGYYSAARAIYHNRTTTIDTTLKFKYVANSRVTLNVVLQNKNATAPLYSDSLDYFKDLGIPDKDTSLIWRIP